MKSIRLQNNNKSNFTLEELTKSNTATRLNIDNTPNGPQKQNIELLVNYALQPIRNRFGPIRISSGFRTLLLNRALHSNDNSYHVIGQAADIEPVNDIKLFNILQWIHYNINYAELIAEFFPYGWIHIAYTKNLTNKQLKLKDHNHNYDLVTIEYINKLYGNI